MKYVPKPLSVNNILRFTLPHSSFSSSVFFLLFLIHLPHSLLLLLFSPSFFSRLRHPNIVCFMGVCLAQQELCIVMEYLKFGSLKEILQNKDVLIEAEHVRRFALDVCRGMAYLHDRNILHRDLKTANLLVSSEWKVKGKFPHFSFFFSVTVSYSTLLSSASFSSASSTSNPLLLLFFLSFPSHVSQSAISASRAS